MTDSRVSEMTEVREQNRTLGRIEQLGIVTSTIDIERKIPSLEKPNWTFIGSRREGCRDAIQLKFKEIAACMGK